MASLNCPCVRVVICVNLDDCQKLKYIYVCVLYIMISLCIPNPVITSILHCQTCSHKHTRTDLPRKCTARSSSVYLFTVMMLKLNIDQSTIPIIVYIICCLYIQLLSTHPTQTATNEHVKTNWGWKDVNSSCWVSCNRTDTNTNSSFF